MRITIKVVLGTLFLLVLGVGFTWVQLQPPEPSLVPPRHGVLSNVTIIEPGFGRALHKTIVVSGDEIVEIRDATDDERTRPVRFVLPGLIDMHVHQPLGFGGLPDYYALLYLKHGVTSVRYTGYSDTGNQVERQRDRIDVGEIPGPRIYSCGPMIDGDPPLWSSSIVPTDPEDAESLVANLAATGVDCIKVYSNLEEDVLSAVVRAAREHNLPIVGHVPTGIKLEDSGIADVQHLIGVPSVSSTGNLGNPMADGWSTLSPERIAQVAEYSKTNGIAHTPTLVFLWTNSIRDRHEQLIAETSSHLLPRLFQHVAWQPQDSIRLGGRRTEVMQETLRAAYKRALEVVGELHRAGVAIHAGTDTASPFVIQGAALIQELSLLTAAGLSNEEALAAATTVPGKNLGRPSSGKITKGGPADILVLEADPIADLSALNRIDTVVAAGRFYSIDFLENELSRYQQQYGNVTWDKILPMVAQLAR